MRFIDLFAGLGGFHLAMTKLGHECVFACEIDKTLQEVYEANFDMRPAGDISQISVADIPQHEILCAGFPCQSFSKAGSQGGILDARGGLLRYVLEIIQHHEPDYVLLENVANFERHNSGTTYLNLKTALETIGYEVDAERYSPHHLGIPQIRDRLFIVASMKGLDQFCWPDRCASSYPTQAIYDILDESPKDARPLSTNVIQCLDVWQQFLDLYPAEGKLPSFPIWSMEFGATYPYASKAPLAHEVSELRRYHGSHGKSLAGLSAQDLAKALPSHARRSSEDFPQWKVNFIRQNRELYEHNKSWLDSWLPKITKFPSSFQKFEWNCQGEERNLWNLVIQFRASGVRVKRPTTAPSLVAMTATQVPIIGKERRYMTPRECARLQSMQSLKSLPTSETKAFQALGNAVNVEVVALIAEALLDENQQFRITRPLKPVQRQLSLIASDDSKSAVTTHPSLDSG